ncbi:helix-turn-helix domain-containing protein [Pseudomonas hefeiensis]
MHGAGRVYTLRHQYGWDIRTVPTISVDAQGRTHKGVARYVLVKEGVSV